MLAAAYLSAFTSIDDGYGRQTYAHQEGTHATRQQYASVRPPRSFIYSKYVGTFEQQSPCYDSIDAPKSEQCQQWRMAEAAEKQAVWSMLQAILSAVAVIGLIWTLYYTRRATEAATDVARISERHLIAAERPWISVKVRIVSSLVFKDGEGRITIDFILKNCGKSPALNVEVKHNIVPLAHQEFDKLKEITNLAKQGLRRRMLGHKIFPNDPFTFSISIPIEKADIDAATANRGVPELVGTISPVLVGCVVYNSSIDDENHITEFIASISRLDPSHPNSAFSIETKDGEIPMERLRMDLSFGSGSAD